MDWHVRELLQLSMMATWNRMKAVGMDRSGPIQEILCLKCKDNKNWWWLRYGRGVRKSVKGGPYMWVAGWIMDKELLKRILFGRRIKSLFLVCWFWDGIGICKRNFQVGKWIYTSRALRGGLRYRYIIVSHHIQVPIKSTRVGEIAREKKRADCWAQRNFSIYSLGRRS